MGHRSQQPLRRTEGGADVGRPERSMGPSREGRREGQRSGARERLHALDATMARLAHARSRAWGT